MFKSLRIIALVLASLGTLAEAAASVPPDQLVRETADRVLTQVQVNKNALEMDTSKIYELVDQYILPHFNFIKMSRSVLGKHWLKATAEQQTRFTEAFQVLLVRTYAVALLNYSNQAIEYLPFRMQSDARMAVVKTRVSDGAGPPLPVDYLLQVEEESTWKVVDVKIDGISLVSNYRTSFSEQVRREGLDGLIQQLRTRGGDLAQESGMDVVDQPPPDEQEAVADVAYGAGMQQNEQPAPEPLTEQPEPPVQAEPPEPTEVVELEHEAPAQQAPVAEAPAVVQPIEPLAPAQAVKEERPAALVQQPVEAKPQPAKQEHAEPVKPVTSAEKPATKPVASVQKPKRAEQKPTSTPVKADSASAVKPATDKAAQAADKASTTASTDPVPVAAPPPPKKARKLPSFLY
ncbi:MAG: ABC transporter substrate-binding protein [Gammaproteobacteria bacterium]|nr:ABC transporter substrate-binding protein [Gammaproteobacteria bacterium]MBU1653376.1 ABC transporter substrate-binding protein [Gammaproteobacteria bacterium]MBU1960829.1 ABC transporter substrate-binding protein [Gammaproteobacteria bacterium]